MPPFEEAVLFLALLIALAALVEWLWKLNTKRGQARQKASNTDRIVEAVNLTCPTHGQYPLYKAVLGVNPCPECFRLRKLTERNTSNTPQ